MTLRVTSYTATHYFLNSAENNKKSMASSEDLVKIEWTGYCEALLSGIWRFFDNQLLVDTSLTCHQHGLKVHRLILAVFFPGLENSLNEDVGRRRMAELCLDYVTSDGRRGDVLTYLMQFAYSGKVDIPKDRLKDVLHAAELMGCEPGLAASIRAHHGNDRKTARTSAALNNCSASISDVKVECILSACDNEMELETLTPTVPKRAKRKGVPVKLVKSTSPATNSGHSTTGKCCNAEEPIPLCERPRRNVQNASPMDAAESSGDDYGSEDNESADGTAVSDEDDLDWDASKEETSSKCERGVQEVTLTAQRPRRKRNRNRRMFACQHCDYTSKDKLTLDNHLVKKHGEAPKVQRYVCDVCAKVFCSNNGYRWHMTTHMNPELQFKCDHCSFISPQKWAWRQHLTGVHQVDELGNPIAGSIKCDQCDFSCAGKHQLKWHVLRKHTPDKPFKCEQCSYGTITRSELTKHVRVRHREECDYMCDTCGFQCRTQGVLNRHKNRHLGLKPFKCEQCGAEYADKGKYKDHLLRHTSDDKPHVCHVCGHAFRRRDNLKEHLRRIHGASVESVNTAASFDS